MISSLRIIGIVLNMPDLNKIWNISPFLKWNFSYFYCYINIWKKITSYHWAFPKPIGNSGSHLNKKYERNGIAYSSDTFMAISLSILRDFASWQERMCISQKSSQKVAALLWKLFIFTSCQHFFFQILFIHSWAIL